MYIENVIEYNLSVAFVYLTACCNTVILSNTN